MPPPRNVDNDSQPHDISNQHSIRQSSTAQISSQPNRSTRPFQTSHHTPTPRTSARSRRPQSSTRKADCLARSLQNGPGPSTNHYASPYRPGIGMNGGLPGAVPGPPRFVAQGATPTTTPTPTPTTTPTTRPQSIPSRIEATFREAAHQREDTAGIQTVLRGDQDAYGEWLSGRRGRGNRSFQVVGAPRLEGMARQGRRLIHPKLLGNLQGVRGFLQTSLLDGSVVRGGGRALTELKGQESDSDDMD